MKVYFPVFAFFPILFSACQHKSGPCDYEITEIKAKIISIDAYQDEKDTASLFHIVLRFNESNLAKQPQLLEELVPRLKGKTNGQFLKSNNIQVGDIYPGTVSEKKSGDCQQLFVSFNNYFKTD